MPTVKIKIIWGLWKSDSLKTKSSRIRAWVITCCYTASTIRVGGVE